MWAQFGSRALCRRGSFDVTARFLSGQLSEEAPQVEKVVKTAPETLIVKRRGRPAGARNKAKAESSTGGTVETAEVPDRERTPDPFVFCTDEAPRHHDGGDDETIATQG